MIPFLSCLPTIVKPVLKKLVSLWSTNESETVKVVAFLCILKLANSDPSVYLEMVLKVFNFKLYYLSENVIYYK